MFRYLLALALLALVLAGCGSGSGPSTFDSVAQDATPVTTVETTTTNTTPSTSVPLPDVPETVASFGTATLVLDGTNLLVAVADDSDERRQGLMGLEDLGDLDGMLFVFDVDTESGFWMKNTLIPLDIAFFDDEGVFVDGFRMEPCTADPCPSYRPGGSYRYALEMPAGTMPVSATRIEIDQ
jgi:uncharacterized protein